MQIARDVSDATVNGGEKKQQTPQQTVGGVQAARSILDILQGFNTPSQLGEDARVYNDRLFEEIKKQIDASMFTMTTDQYECRIFSTADGKYGIPVIFADTYQGLDPEIPVAERVKEISDRWHESGGVLLESIVVTPADYARINKMATHIASTLKLANDVRSMNITTENLKDITFCVTTNINAVRAYVDSRCPHGVPVRDDIGLLVYAMKNKPIRQVNFHNGIPDQDYTPILAVTGYTEFLTTTGAQFGTSTVKFAPIITITSIVSDLVSRKLAAAAITIAAETFIRQSRWLAPYSVFSKESANLGSLIMDESGKPCFCENIEQRNKVLSDYVLPPFLSIDITEGRARISGLDKLVYSPSDFMTDVGQFLGVTIPQQMGNPIIKIWRDYIGEVKLDSKSGDSRSVDYLNLATRIKDINKINKFLFHPEDPKERNRQITETIGLESKVLFTNYHLVLDSGFVNYISEHLAQKMTIVFDTINMGMASNITDLLTSNANAYGGFMPMSGGFGNSWNPNVMTNPYRM